MSEQLKKEIKFRASRRGIKELDMYFGSFMDNYLDDLNEEELTQFRDLMLQSDLDLFAWFEKGEVPAHADTPIFHKVHAHIQAGGAK